HPDGHTEIGPNRAGCRSGRGGLGRSAEALHRVAEVAPSPQSPALSRPWPNGSGWTGSVTPVHYPRLEWRPADQTPPDRTPADQPPPDQPWSGGSSAPRTPPRSSSGWRWRPGSTCSSTTWWLSSG